jgi:hypothetical protein
MKGNTVRCKVLSGNWVTLGWRLRESRMSCFAYDPHPIHRNMVRSWPVIKALLELKQLYLGYCSTDFLHHHGEMDKIHRIIPCRILGHHFYMDFPRYPRRRLRRHSHELPGTILWEYKILCEDFAYLE